EKDILRDILKNPNVTGEQAKRAVQTIQGYSPEWEGRDETLYYLKQEDNGVTMPVPIKYGERPPEGYEVIRAFSNKKDAKNNSWYTDVAKSVYNGVLMGAESILSLAQQGVMAVTDEQSSYINHLRNVADALK